MNPIRFVLINEATAASPLTSQVTSAWLARVAAACVVQLTQHVAPVYGGTYEGRVGKDATDIQPGEMVFSIVDALPVAPGAIAYHDTSGNDVPVAFLALSTCNTLEDVSTAISHEMCETAGDEACDLWADDGQGHEFCRELCDAVESNSYGIDLADGQPPVMVSDFLLPGFFGASDPGPYCFLQTSPSMLAANVIGIPASAFTTAAGGYQIQRTAGTNETQVTGKIREHRKAKVAHWSSRPYRRGARLS